MVIFVTYDSYHLGGSAKPTKNNIKKPTNLQETKLTIKMPPFNF